MRPPPPLVVLERCAPAVVGQLAADAAATGWRVVAGWLEPGHGVVCTGMIRCEQEAASALLAAVAGAGLIVEVAAARDVADRLCDDLRRLGPVDHRIDQAGPAAGLDADEQAILAMLGGGASLGETARALNMSRRTADRRLARARRVLGAATTAEAVALAGRSGLHHHRLDP